MTKKKRIDLINYLNTLKIASFPLIIASWAQHKLGFFNIFF